MPRRPKPIIDPQPETKNATETTKEMPKTEKQPNKHKKSTPEPIKIRVEKGDFFIEFK